MFFARAFRMAQKKACTVFVVKEVLAKPKQKTKNNPRLLQT